MGHICGCGHSVRYCGTSHLLSRPDRKAIRTMSGLQPFISIKNKDCFPGQRDSRFNREANWDDAVYKMANPH